MKNEDINKPFPVAKKPKRKVGRPNLYRPEFVDMAYELCLVGMINSQLAAFFKVTEETLNQWMRLHPDFSDAIARAREPADGKVARSLFERATQAHGKMPPDVNAMRLWLLNRQRARWSGESAPAVAVQVNIDPQVLEMARQIAKELP